MLTEDKLRRICVRAETMDYALGTLPDTYQWAPVLRTAIRQMPVAQKVMGVAFRPGIIFTGPEGNGRHSTAYALANNLAEKAGYQTMMSIHGSDLDFEDPDDIYSVLDFLEKIAAASGNMVLFLDQPGLSRHSLRFQNQLLRSQQRLLREKKTIFLIVIADSAEEVAPTLLGRYPHCHCPRPDTAAASRFVDNMLKKPVPIHMDKVTKADILLAVRGCSWKQLADLHEQLLRLVILGYVRKSKSFAEQGIPEEKVYQDGLIQLSQDAVRMVLDSVAAQNVTLVPAPAAVPYAPVTGGQTAPPPSAVPPLPVADSEDSENIPAINPDEFSAIISGFTSG